MENMIWNEIICNTPKIKDALKFAEPNSNEAKEAAEQEVLFPIPDQKRLSAIDIIKYVCNVLCSFPNFHYVPENCADVMSLGMLFGNDGSKIVHDILLPNLYCVLSLELIGQKVSYKPNEEIPNLADIVKQQDLKAAVDEPETNKSTTKLSNLLSNRFPDALKVLFGVAKKTQSKYSPYQINTQFPKLFLAELEHIKISPLQISESTTANSLVYHKKFYDACIQAIAPNSVWSERSFAEYYLFERIFRLNTKFTLFFSEDAEKCNETLSPQLLGDFFFHSPLVIFPSGKSLDPKKESLQSCSRKKLINLFYEQCPSLDGYLKPMEFLHFLIQLSSFWFPQILGIIREYMYIYKITSFEDILKFFFPNREDFPTFLEEYTPTLHEFSIRKRKTSTDKNLPRALKDTYSNRWSTFAPDFGCCAESFTFYSLDDWSQKLSSSYRKSIDYRIIREIQDTLY